MRKKELAKYRDKAIEPLMEMSIEDRAKPFLVSGQITYTVNDVIREVECLTDFGMKYIRSWVSRNKK